MTAQRILRAHLRPKAVDQFWPDIDLDLSEARLHQLELADCHIRNVHFGGTRFRELAVFNGAQIGGYSWFTKMKFGGYAVFKDAQFSRMRGLAGHSSAGSRCSARHSSARTLFSMVRERG